MDNGTIVLEILRNLSDDDAYTLIDVFENHNDDEECIKEFNKVIDKIQNVVNKLDSNFLTNFKDKEELAYFTYYMVMDYHSNDLTQEKIDKSLDFFRKNKMSESTNKYIKAFRESCRKLEETPTAEYEYNFYDEPYENGTQTYDISTDIVNRITSIIKQLNIIGKKSTYEDDDGSTWKNHFNLDAIHIARQCSDLLSELLNSYELSSPKLRNVNYVNRKENEPIRWNRDKNDRLDSKFLRSNKILPYSTRDKK